MNHIELIKRAASLTWRYKVLWILGILLALTSSSGGGNGVNYIFSGGNGGNGAMPPSFTGWQGPDPALALSFVAICCCALLILAIVGTIVRYVARTGLYRAVDQIEADGAAPTWRQALRLGWNNRALRIFLLDLLVGIAFTLLALLLLALGALPLLLLVFDNDVVRVIGIVGTIGLELLVAAVLVAGVIAISLLSQFWSREIALADGSVGEALSSGYGLVRRRLGDLALMWLLMFAIGLLFGIVLIPAVLALAFGGLAVGGGLGYAIYGLTDSWLLAVLAGLPLFLLIVAVPFAIVQGIYLAFESSVWTLTYRQVVASQPRLPALPAAPPLAEATGQ